MLLGRIIFGNFLCELWNKELTANHGNLPITERKSQKSLIKKELPKLYSSIEKKNVNREAW
jgi:hypothetical protein